MIKSLRKVRCLHIAFPVIASAFVLAHIQKCAFPWCFWCGVELVLLQIRVVRLSMVSQRAFPLFFACLPQLGHQAKATIGAHDPDITRLDTLGGAIGLGSCRNGRFAILSGGFATGFVDQLMDSMGILR